MEIFVLVSGDLKFKKVNLILEEGLIFSYFIQTGLLIQTAFYVDVTGRTCALSSCFRLLPISFM